MTELYPSGKNKAFMVDYAQIAELPDDDEICVKLTSQQIWTLIVQCKYLGWSTRWMNNPPEFDIQAFKAELETRLMCDCECFDCDDVAGCIETSEPTQEALDNHISNYLATNGWGQSPGKPLPPTVSGANLAGATNEYCNLDIVWAQCLFLVQATNGLIEDLLQKFETLTNPVELADAAADTIPLVGDTISAAPAYINLVQNFLTENYLADYTTTPITGYEDVLACELFCACKGDCEITIDRMFTILLNRVEARFESSPALLNTISDLTSWMVGIDVSGELVADMAFLMVWGGIKLANFVIGGLTGRPKIGDGVLKMYLEIAADDPSPDWLTICAECPEYEDIVIDVKPYPVTGSGFTVNAYAGDYTGGDNIRIDTPSVAQVVLPINRRVVGLHIPIAFNDVTGGYVTIEGDTYDLVRGEHLGGSAYVYDVEVPNILTDTINIQFAANSETGFVFVAVANFTVTVWEL